MDSKYFSVFVDCNIMGGRHMPGVCYKLTSAVAPIVSGMVERKMARIYDSEVRFVSGEPIPYTRRDKEMLHGNASQSSPLVGAPGASPSRPVILQG